MPEIQDGDTKSIAPSTARSEWASQEDIRGEANTARSTAGPRGGGGDIGNAGGHDSSEDEDIHEDIPTGPIGKLLHGVRAKMKGLEDTFQKYGPPYQEDYGGNLPEECNSKNASTLEIHSLLKEGADPRIGNSEDFMNTPLHYACRFCHTRIAKMLKKADSKPSIINTINEHGVSPLETACMFPQAYPRKKRHLRFVKWLISNGADVNHIDKAGQTALHFAAYSGRIKVVQLLINSGAKVSRDLEFLSLYMASPVDFAAESIARDRGNIERILVVKTEMERSARAAIRDEALAAQERARQDEAERLRKLKLAEERKARWDEKLRLRAEALRENAMAKSGQKSRRTDQKRAERRERQDKEHRTGMWFKADPHRWEFKKGISAARVKEQNLMREVEALNEEITGAEKQKAIRRRWKQMTGTRLVELDPDGHEILRGKKGRTRREDQEEDHLAVLEAVEIPTLCI